MKLADLIARIDATKPNQYDKDLKTQWVNEIEYRAIDQVINMARGNHRRYAPYVYDLDAEKELAIPDMFVDVYVYYLSAKIDMLYSEIDRYNNDVLAYETAWKNYASWYRRNHYPKSIWEL